MLIHRIFHRPRTKNPNARGRRFSSGICLRLESLENRTPLSSGLGAAIEAAVVSRVAEIGLPIPHLPLVVEWTSLGASISDQAASTGPSQVVLMNAPLSVSLSTTPASAPALEQVASDLPASAVFSSVNPTTGPDGTIGSGPIQALIQAAASAGNVDEPPSAQPAVAGTLRSLLPDIAYAIDHVEIEGAGDALLFPFPPGTFAPMGPAFGRISSQTNNDDGQATDMSYAGSLESIEMDDGILTWTAATPATSRSTSHALSFVVTDPSLQVEASSEVPNTSGLSYLATGGGPALYAPTPAGDNVQTSDEGSPEPISPVSITVGGVSLNVLLSSTDERIQTEPGGLDLVAELVPLPESSLALAATLWTVPSDSPTARVQWDLSAGKAIDPDARRASASSWVLFVTGMDGALEQASRDIRDGIFSRDGHPTGNGAPPGGPDELIEWQGPILPASQGELPKPIANISRTGRAATFDAAGQGAVRTEQNSRADSDNGQPVVLGVMPMISAVSISTLIAGWFWRKRQRGQRSGVRGRGSENRSTDGATTP